MQLIDFLTTIPEFRITKEELSDSQHRERKLFQVLQQKLENRKYTHTLLHRRIRTISMCVKKSEIFWQSSSIARLNKIKQCDDHHQTSIKLIINMDNHCDERVFGI